MIEADCEITVKAFQACLPARCAKAKNDRLFLEALHYFAVHNVTWRALPERFGHWNSVWIRFDRLGNAGVSEDFFAMLTGLSGTARLVQMFDATVIRAHVSAAGAKGARPARLLAAHATGSARNPIKNRSLRAPYRLRTDRWQASDSPVFSALMDA